MTWKASEKTWRGMVAHNRDRVALLLATCFSWFPTLADHFWEIAASWNICHCLHNVEFLATRCWHASKKIQEFCVPQVGVVLAQICESTVALQKEPHSANQIKTLSARFMIAYRCHSDVLCYCWIALWLQCRNHATSTISEQWAVSKPIHVRYVCTFLQKSWHTQFVVGQSFRSYGLPTLEYVWHEIVDVTDIKANYCVWFSTQGYHALHQNMQICPPYFRFQREVLSTQLHGWCIIFVEEMWQGSLIQVQIQQVQIQLCMTQCITMVNKYGMVKLWSMWVGSVKKRLKGCRDWIFYYLAQQTAKWM